jgi:hypothetical protein
MSIDTKFVTAATALTLEPCGVDAVLANLPCSAERSVLPSSVAH